MAPGRPLPPSVEPPGAAGGARGGTPRAEATRSPAAGGTGAAADIWRRPALRVLRWSLAVVFVGAGVAKLFGEPSTVTLFAMVALGQWFRYAVGAYELLGAALLAYRRTAIIGATGLIALMVGAGATEILILERFPLSSGATLVALALLAAGLRSDRTTT